MKKESDVLFPFVDENPEAFTNITGAHTLLRTKGVEAPRDMSKVDTIVLHQTTNRLGWEPDCYYETAAHVAVTSRGGVLYINDLAFTVYHGHSFTPCSIGLAIDGNFAGIEGDRSTVISSKPHQLTEEQITGARFAILWIIGECAARGASIRKIVAHRQSSNQKQADPGSSIWRSVGLWAQRELDLRNDFYETRGAGYSIPRQWDIRSLFGWGGEIDKVGIAIVQAVCNKRVESELVVDGIVGRHTRAAIYILNDNFKLKGLKIISHETIKAIVAAPEFIEVTDWIAAEVKQREIPVHLLGGVDLIDLFAVYEG